ncbi:MAG: hypothetical protein L6R28_17230 [Planctomycetes bacterium]|nr:hypothetical protein [Planctomycetota bacterium]
MTANRNTHCVLAGLKAAALVLACLAALPGCGRRKVVEDTTTSVQARIQVEQLPYAFQSEMLHAGRTWHEDLLVVLPARPKNAEELKAAVVEHRGPARTAAEGLARDIDHACGQALEKEEHWSVVNVAVGDSVSRHKGLIPVRVDLGLRALYAYRPEIAFQDVPFDRVMTTLATQAGMRHGQGKLNNPLVSWRRRNVTTLDAIDAITDAHGFKRRYVGVTARITLQVREFETREAFFKTLAAETEKAVANLARDVPAVLILPNPKTPKPDTPEAAEKKEEAKKKDEAPPAPLPEPDEGE